MNNRARKLCFPKNLQVYCNKKIFYPDYFGSGFRYHDPKVDWMELAYRKAREFFEKNGGMVFIVTICGRLKVFERVEFNALFSKAA